MQALTFLLDENPHTTRREKRTFGRQLNCLPADLLLLAGACATVFLRCLSAYWSVFNLTEIGLRIDCLCRRREAEALCSQLNRAGRVYQSAGMSCETTLAIVATARGAFQSAVDQLMAESNAVVTRRKAATVMGEDILAGKRDRHVAEIASNWVESLRFNSPPLPQPAAAGLNTLRALQQKPNHTADSGGWNSRESSALVGDGRCNVDIRHAGKDITPEEFQSEYVPEIHELGESA